MNPDPKLIAAIRTVFPHLRDTAFAVSHAGWDSVAVMGGGHVFKFPRHAKAEDRLRREFRILSVLRHHVQMTLPDMVLHEVAGARFSSHVMISGEHLLTAQYVVLPDQVKDTLAEHLARFFADIHAMDQESLRVVGAEPLPPWPSVESVRHIALPLLPRTARQAYGRILDQFEQLPPDPHGTIFGMFDCHGWNMAFDHEAQRLNGLYDFADSAFGPLHLDFMPVTKIALDLALRVAGAYETMTGRRLDRARIVILTGMNRINEVTQEAGNPDTLPDMLHAAIRWLDEVESLTPAFQPS